LILGSNFTNNGEIEIKEEAALTVSGFQKKLIHNGNIKLGIFSLLQFDTTNFNLNGGTVEDLGGATVALPADSALIVDANSATGTAAWNVRGPVTGTAKLTVSPGGNLIVTDSTVGVALDNDGLLEIKDTVTFNGIVDNKAGRKILVNGTLRVSNVLSNSGTIERASGQATASVEVGSQGKLVLKAGTVSVPCDEQR
jgi:hypothetical protein